jgi:hypothetical protein
VEDGARTLCRKDEERVLARLSTAKYLRRLNIHGFSDRFHVGHEVRRRALIYIFIYLFMHLYRYRIFLVGSTDIWFVGTFRHHSCCLKPIFIAKFDQRQLNAVPTDINGTGMLLTIAPDTDPAPNPAGSGSTVENPAVSVNNLPPRIRNSELRIRLISDPNPNCLYFIEDSKNLRKKYNFAIFSTDSDHRC